MAIGDTQRDISVIGLIGSGLGLLQRQWRVLLALAVINSLLQLVQKFEAAAHIGGTAIVAVVMFAVLVAQFIIGAVFVRMILTFEGLASDAAPIRYFTYLGTSIVVFLAYMLGAILFVVPGIMIMLRWMLAPTYVLARGVGVGDALKASSAATSGHRWAIFGALLLTGIVLVIPFIVLIPAAGGMMAYAVLAWNSGIGLVVLLAGALVGTIFNAILLGIFIALAGGEERFDEVFG